MEYQLNLGIWNQVFAVPTAIVDQHLKLAGAAQLKVLLWFLRHAGEPISTEQMSSALMMHEADVKDSLQYWVQTGVIVLRENQLIPVPVTENTRSPEPEFSEHPAVELSAKSDSGISKNPEPQQETAGTVPAPVKPVTKSRALSRPEKPDQKYITRRIMEDESIAFLMQSADELYGRMTGNNDKATLLLIHDYDGLPVEVIIMLMQYAFSIGKGNMRYIEKMAINWADKEINTLEAAELMIKKLTESNSAAKTVQRIIGADDHSPTEKEKELADTWLNRWQFSPEMIRAAYETCVDTKGKYIPNYTGTILANWYKKGYTTVEQTKNEKAPSRQNKKESYAATYDISEYEKTSVIDEEW